MKKAEVTEKPLNVEVIPRRVKPETVEKLQTEAAERQKTIDKLQADLALQNGRIEDLEAIVSP